MNFVGAILTLTFSAVVLLAPRRIAALGVVAGVCYVTQGQQVNFLGFHFTAIRMVLLAGILRCALRGEFKAIQINPIDKALIGYGLSQLCVYTFRERTSDALVYMLGCSYDVFLSYFLLRSLISNLEDAQGFFAGLAVLIIPFAGFMILESTTGTNVFRIMGGQGWESVVMRGDRARGVGSFRGPHTAGIFGAALLPMFFGLWRGFGLRGAAVLGVITAALITIASNSSGPLMAFYGGLAALAFWPMRENMRLVRRGIVGTLLGLHLYMKAPVWFLFMKISNITGGDGWTRSFVIDSAIHHFSDWWLIGTSSTGSWSGEDVTTGDIDITNQFVASGVNGGLIGLVFFILIIVRCYRGLGQAMALARSQFLTTDSFFWGLGAALFAHVVALFSVSYFDQIHVIWWGSLAIIASSTGDFIRESTPVQEPEEIPDGDMTGATAV